MSNSLFQNDPATSWKILTSQLSSHPGLPGCFHSGGIQPIPRLGLSSQLAQLLTSASPTPNRLRAWQDTLKDFSGLSPVHCTDCGTNRPVHFVHLVEFIVTLYAFRRSKKIDPDEIHQIHQTLMFRKTCRNAYQALHLDLKKTHQNTKWLAIHWKPWYPSIPRIATLWWFVT